MDYQVDFHPQVRKDLQSLPPRISQKILEKLDSLRKTEFKSPQIKHLKQYGNFFRLRVEKDYRVVYEIRGERVTVLLVGHRKDIYSRLARLFRP